MRTESTGALTFLTDILGSTIALADSTGTIQTQYSYEPFGRTLRTGASSSNGFKFTGREDDAVKMYYLRARYYHPELHRFISEDPIEFEAGDSNLYAYVWNDPVNFVDPYGENPAAAIGGAAARGAAGAASSGVGATAGAGVGGIILGGIVGAAGGVLADFMLPSPAGGIDDMLPPSMCLMSKGSDYEKKGKPSSVWHKKKKQAYEAARNEGSGPPDFDTKDPRGPHFHPTNKQGKGISGRHHRYHND